MKVLNVAISKIMGIIITDKNLLNIPWYLYWVN